MKKIKNLFSKFFRKKKEKKEPIPETVLFSGKPFGEDFYSTVKLKTGEELFARVMADKEEDKTLLLLNTPVVITEMKTRRGVVGYKLEPWLKTIKDDLVIIDINEVLSITENDDMTMISMYEKYSSHEDYTSNSLNITRKMGYISSVSDAKKILEKLYNNS